VKSIRLAGEVNWSFLMQARVTPEEAKTINGAMRQSGRCKSGWMRKALPTAAASDKPAYKTADAASLGLAICNCKERQVCQLTYAHKPIWKLHAF